MNKNVKKFLNRKAGGASLAIVIVAAYIATKYLRTGLSINLIWYGLWFTGFVMSALATDFFENVESWVFESLKKLKGENISAEQKVQMIKSQLRIAVKQYDSLFFRVNGIGESLGRIRKRFKKIGRGVISVKELIVIIGYALFDLLIRSGGMSLGEPWDVALPFIILVILRMIGADQGSMAVLVDLYQTAFNQQKQANDKLPLLEDYIKQLAHLFNVEHRHREYGEDA